MTALLLFFTALLIALNAFFVAGEYALVRSRRSRLEALKDEGARGATLALEQVDEIGDYISAVQVEITMTSIGIGALGEPVLADLLEPLFSGPPKSGSRRSARTGSPSAPMPIEVMVMPTWTAEM